MLGWYIFGIKTLHKTTSQVNSKPTLLHDRGMRLWEAPVSIMLLFSTFSKILNDTYSGGGFTGLVFTIYVSALGSPVEAEYDWRLPGSMLR